MVGTLYTKSDKWLLKQARRLVPYEMFLLQDFDLLSCGIRVCPCPKEQCGPSAEDTDEWRLTDCQVLTGDAFQGSSLAVVILALLVGASSCTNL